MPETPLLELRDVRTGYGPIEVLKGISLEVREGEIVTMIGANGAGKTTTLMTVSGLVPLRTGAVLYRGESLAGIPPHKIVEMGVCQIPEGRRIFPRLTVLENLEMGGFIRKDRAGIADDMEKSFHRFPVLRERQAQLGGTLSGGEQQMLAIARALMARPRLLLLDEPSLGLAPLIVSKVFEILREVNKDGVTLLLVEQHAKLALKTAHRGYVLETGRITMSDAASALLADPRVQDAYLGS
ncbi:MAG: ABC transporter ATP-binding protein [Planctomycetes bacterium]|nr:ABC transporter ATP-binding protein [Planctomycetota bacterium]